MGINIFLSSDSREFNYKPPGVFYKEKPETYRINSTPDPEKFEILDKKIINGYPILTVKYPDVLNYEGKKILMYKKDFDLKLIEKRIDPHFFTEGDSPIARFEPTDYGLNLAITLAKNLK